MLLRQPAAPVAAEHTSGPWGTERQSSQCQDLVTARCCWLWRFLLQGLRETLRATTPDQDVPRSLQRKESLQAQDGKLQDCDQRTPQENIFLGQE